jgi:hypothetical protein
MGYYCQFATMFKLGIYLAGTCLSTDMARAISVTDVRCRQLVWYVRQHVKRPASNALQRNARSSQCGVRGHSS